MINTLFYLPYLPVQLTAYLILHYSGDANAYKLAFWMLSHIIFDPALYAVIQAELASTFHPDGGLSLSHLTQQSCPHLNALYLEAMRYSKRDVAVRKIVADTPLDGKILRKGNLAFIPLCQLHENEAVFGDNVGNFKPERFLDRPDLARSESFKPFGAGRTYRPGRFLVVPEVFRFIAVLVRKLGLALEPELGGEQDDRKEDGMTGQRFPRRDEQTFKLGISRPVPADKVWVCLHKQI